MPGRVFLSLSVAEIAKRLEADPGGVADPGAGREAGAGDTVAALVAAPARQLVEMRWGLIPMGRANARGRPVMETIVNARSETLFAKSAFVGLRRCALPVSGWFEWTGPRRRRIRWTLSAANGRLLPIAAVYDVWSAPGGLAVTSLATVTCAPNPDVAPVHDRMPAILDPAGLAVWLGEAEGDPAATLRPLDAGRLRVEAG